MEKLYTYLGMITMVVVIVAGLIYINGQYNVAPSVQPDLGSIATGQEYSATTTPSGIGEWTTQLIREGWGTLGSVIVTTAGDVEYVLYDATSTGAVANDSRFVNSLQQLARIEENQVAGTYVFDVTYINGLVLEVQRGTTGTSTITFR